MAFAASGLRTIGLDVDAARVAALQAGSSHIDDVPDTMLAAAAQFEATTDPDALTKADAIFLCVPTPFDATKTPVLDFVRAAATTVGAQLRSGQLVDPAVDHVPRHHHRGRPADPRGRERPARRRRLPPRVLARTRRSRQHHLDARATRRRSAVASPPSAAR